MKHMLVNTHNAESCGFRGKEEGDAIGAAIEGLMKSGLTVDHFWINRAAHAFFIVVDAQSAHEASVMLTYRMTSKCRDPQRTGSRFRRGATCLWQHHRAATRTR